MLVAACRRLVRLTLRTVAVSAAAVVLVTCTDSPVGPGKGGIAHLRLQPVFDAYSRVAPLTLDRIRVVVIRPRTDTLADVSQSFSPIATSVRLDIPVRLEQTREDLELNLELYAGSLLLFAGADTVPVAAGTSNPAAPIPVSYRGPGANVAVLTLLPRDTTVPAGAVFDMQASALDAQQAPVPQFYVSWSATAGTIDAAGQFTAPAVADTVWVRAVTPTQIWDSTRVFVTGLPAQLTIAGGDGQTGLTGSRLPLPLAVQVRDANNQPVPGVVAAFSVLTGGGSVDSATATTDAQGIARSGVTLGPTQGTQTFRAAVGNLPALTFTATATTLPAPTTVLLSAGDQFSCDLRAGGAAYCWGLNSSGQLGDGTTTNRRVPTPVAGGLTFTSISAGAGHACGVATGGTVYCWGSNSNGQLGDGTTTGHLTPAAVSGGGSFSAVHAGAAFTCALSTTGQAFCWGNNGAGNLGDGSTSQRLVPTAVAGGLTFLQLSLFADNHACGLTTAGDVYCWGYNFDGAVGDGTTTNRSVPTLVLGGRTYQAVTSAHYHSCALDVGGAAWCWGDNQVGQIGDGGAPTDRLAPVQVQGGRTFSALKAGGSHTCGLTAGGQVYCWGINSSGQLGNGTTTGSQAPVLVSGTGFTAVSTGETHTCGLAGGARCWGDNAAGQVGDGTTGNQLAPVAVQNPPASLSIQAGNNQVAAPGAAVAIPPAVLVRDALNNPLTGVEVIFAVTGGGGSIPGSTAITASNGIASVASWTLGTTPGTNTLTATVSAGGVSGNPVTFTATGTTGPIPLQWNGSASTDWNTAANWSPAQVPTTSDDVVIPAVVPTPVVTTSCAAKSLTVDVGATLDLNGINCQVAGSGVADGPVTGAGAIEMSGPGTTVQGSFSGLTILSAVTLNGPTAVQGNLLVSGASANFDFGSANIAVAGTFDVQGGAIFTMTNPVNSLVVGGNITLNGGNTTGLLTAGTITAYGSFNVTSSQGFNASGTHRVVLGGSQRQSISFVSGQSRFNELDISSAAGGVFVTSTSFANLLISHPAAAPPVLSRPITTLQFQVTGADVSGLVTDGVPIYLGNGPITQFDNVTFQGNLQTFTQLSVTNIGAAPLTFNNLVFLTAPTTGHRVVANDADGATSGVLTVNLVNPTPASPAAQDTLTINNAVINWPAASPGLTWNGSFNADWDNPVNWTPQQVPSPSTDVTIPAGKPHQPTLSTDAFAANLTLQSGGTQLGLGDLILQVSGNLVLDGAVTSLSGGRVVMAGANDTLSGAGLLQADLEIQDTTLLGSTFTMQGSLTTSSLFSLNGQGMSVIGNFTTTSATGLLHMVNPAEVLVVTLNATFDGGDHLNACPGGCLTEGVLAIGGNLTQLATNSPDSYHPSGNHLTVFTGANPTVSFATPGIVPGSSHFETLEWSAAGTMTLASDVYAHGDLFISSGSPPTIAGTDRLLQVGGYAGTLGLTLDGVRLAVDDPFGTGSLGLHDLTFVNIPATRTQLSIVHPGTGSPFSFTNLTFSTPPTAGGFYLSAVDAASTDGVPLVIDMVNPTPATDGGFKQELNGAVINWSTVSPGVSWTGGVSSSWDDPGNWSGNAVPTAADDVTIPAGTLNSPQLQTSCAAASLAVNGGAFLDMGDVNCSLQGNLYADGTITAGLGAFTISGAAQLRGALPTGLTTDGAVTLVGPTSVAGTLLINSGMFTVNGQKLTVGLNLNTFVGGGVLVMTNPADTVDVLANAVWQGGDESGLLTAGLLRVGGGLLQSSVTSTASFAASGTHTTYMTDSTNTINWQLQSGGAGPGSSHAQHLIYQGGLGPQARLHMGSAAHVYVLGTTTVLSAGTIGSATGSPTATNGFHTAQLVTGGPLTLNAQLLIETPTPTPVSLSNITINTPNRTALFIRHPGLPVGTAVTLAQMTFTNVPTLPAVYIDADDITPGDADSVVVDVISSSPSSSGGLVNTANGAVINWPAVGGVISWSGLFSDDWSVAGNWSPNKVPTALDTVSIAPGGSFSPKLSGSVAVRSLTIQPGIALDVDTAVLVVGGSLDVSGAINGVQGTGAVILAGSGQLKGTVNVDLMIAGPYTLNFGASALSLSIAGDSGSLAIGPFGFTTTSDFSTLNSGTVTMADPGGQLLVGGSATFAGGDQTGKLTAGILEVAGDFQQIGLSVPTSFVADTGHSTSLIGDNPAVSFTDPGSSHFFDLYWGGIGGTLSLGNDIRVLNTFTAPDGPATMLGSGHTLTAGNLFTQFLTVDNLPIVIDQPKGGIFTFVFGLTFTNMATTATQLTIRDPGNANGINLDQVAFDSLSTGATGLYLSAEDTDLNDAIPLLVNLISATPADPTNGGADKFYLKVTGTEVIDWNGQALP